MFVIDGYLTQVDHRVLINNQSNGVNNGIYVVTGSSPPYSWARSSDMALGSDALGSFCFIQNGFLFYFLSFF